MSITILSRISMCADDLVLLDKMAANAGKSRDVFLSDIIFHVLTFEHQRIKHGETAPWERMDEGA